MKLARWVLAVWMLAVIASCGGPTEPHNITVSTRNGATPPFVATKLPRLGLPKDAALVAVFDARVAKGLIGDVAAVMEQLLGTSEIEEVGIDPDRPIVVAMASANDAQKRLLDEIRPLTQTTSPSSKATDMLRRIPTSDPVPPTRVLLPSTDTAKLEAGLVARLTAQGWHTRNEGGLVHGSQVMRIAHDDANVALDFCGLQTPPVVGHDAPPPLEGRSAMVTWSPTAFASFGVLSAVTVLSGALSGESIDPTVRASVAAQGFSEAGRFFTLAGNASGAFFDRVDVSLRMAPFELTIRAKAGPAFPLLPAETWKPSTSVAIDGAWADADGSSALWRAWPFPSGSGANIMSLVRDGGAGAWLVALPHLVAAAPLVAAKLLELPDAEAMASRFERTGLVWMTGTREVAVGLLPAQTTRAQAECVMSPATSPAPCSARSKLKVGSVRAISGVSSGLLRAKLLEVDHRFVVLIAHDAGDLDLTAQLGQTSPLHADLSLVRMAPLLKTSIAVPDRVVGDMTFDGGAISFRLAPP